MLTISSQPRYAFSAIAIASRLALNARRSCLVCALHSSKDDPSNWVLDWHVSQYLYINVVDADPFHWLAGSACLIFRHQVSILTFITSFPAVCTSFAVLRTSVCAFDDDNLHLKYYGHERRQH